MSSTGDARDPRKKMTRILASSVTWIRDFISLPYSNIPIVVNFTKMTLFIDQLPFRMHKQRFVLTNANKRRGILAVLILLLHLGIILKWVLDQWLNPVNHSRTIWKFVLMYYCVTVFCTIMVFIAQLTLLKEETISLLNLALQIERDSSAKGEFF